MNLQIGLEHIVAAWDGKATASLEDAYVQYGREPWFIALLVQWHAQRPLQLGASWLLKKYLDNGGGITAEQIHALYASLPELEHWATRLHVLQSMSYMPIEPADLEIVEQFVRGNIQAKQKFVRAWAYHGFWEWHANMNSIGRRWRNYWRRHWKMRPHR